MFSISASHIAGMEATRHRAFVAQTVDVVREKAPAYLAAHDDKAAASAIEAGIDLARRYGLTTERQIRAFIALQTAAGERFDTDPRYPGAQEALNHPTLDADARIRRTTAMVRLVLEGEA